MLPYEYLDQNFWNKPHREHHGDPSADVIYCAVGTALSQWEQLECVLSDIFSVLVESGSHAACRVYGNIASAVGRVGALDCAADVFFEIHHLVNKQPYIDTIKPVKYAAARRNDFAHGIVTMYAAPDKPGGGHYLVAPEYNTRRTDAFISLPTEDEIALDPFSWTRHGYAYTANQIVEFSKRFARLEHEAANLARNLAKARRLV